jgi:hypothetical protein
MLDTTKSSQHNNNISHRTIKHGDQHDNNGDDLHATLGDDFFNNTHTPENCATIRSEEQQPSNNSTESNRIFNKSPSEEALTKRLVRLNQRN